MQDQQLLSEYRQTRSQQAFGELVRRYADVVYAAARRQTKVPAMAEDVAQAVFLLLSQKAGRVGRGELLAGWLLRATWFTSRRAVTAEKRREHHERGAAAMRTEATEPAWDTYSEEIDAAMAKLGAAERSAVTLRYFCGLSLREVGEQMSLSEDAARKRVDQGLEKLRTLLAKKVIAPSAAGLAVAMAANGSEAAPASVLAIGTGQASAGVIALAEGVGKIMAWAKARLIIFIGAAFILLGSGATVMTRHIMAETPRQPAATQPSVIGSAVDLPGGAGTVELAAVGRNPLGTTEWWRPDGTASVAPGFDGFERDRVSVAQGESAFQLALQLRGLAEDASVKWMVTPSAGGSNTAVIYGLASKGGREVAGGRDALAVLPTGQKTAIVQVTIAGGQQETLVVNPQGKLVTASRRAETMMSPDSASEEPPNAPLALGPAARKVNPNARGMTTLWLRQREAKLDVKATVVTKDGKRYSMTTWNDTVVLHDGQPGYAIGFQGVGLDSVKQFEVSLRRSTQRVTFENVSLAPGMMTKVVAKVEVLPNK